MPSMIGRSVTGLMSSPGTYTLHAGTTSKDLLILVMTAYGGFRFGGSVTDERVTVNVPAGWSTLYANNLLNLSFGSYVEYCACLVCWKIAGVSEPSAVVTFTTSGTSGTSNQKGAVYTIRGGSSWRGVGSAMLGPGSTGTVTPVPPSSAPPGVATGIAIGINSVLAGSGPSGWVSDWAPTSGGGFGSFRVDHRLDGFASEWSTTKSDSFSWQVGMVAAWSAKPSGPFLGLRV